MLIDMKILKILTVISFLIIVFPGKIYFINLQLIPLVFFSTIISVGVDPIDLEFVWSLLMSISVMLSTVYIFKKSKIYSLVCIAIQYVHLVNSFNSRDISNVYYISTMALYLIVSLILVVALLQKSKQIQNGDGNV